MIPLSLKLYIIHSDVSKGKVRVSDGLDSAETVGYEAFVFINWSGQSQYGAVRNPPGKRLASLAFSSTNIIVSDFVQRSIEKLCHFSCVEKILRNLCLVVRSLKEEKNYVSHVMCPLIHGTQGWWALTQNLRFLALLVWDLQS